MKYIYRSALFENAMNEYFDLHDKETFSYLHSIEEADQNKVLLALTSRLYDHLVEKVDDIDFGDIPKSRGDITKLPNYEKVVDCTTIIKGILINAHQDVESVIVIETAIANLVKNKEVFVKAYQLNTELPMMIYNTTVLSIYSGLSVLISSCIEFIKSTDNTGFDISLDKVGLKKSKDSLLFKNLRQVNDSFNNGLAEALDEIIKAGSVIKESTLMAAIGAMTVGQKITGAVVLVLGIIPAIRELIYYWYSFRTKVSEYFDIQSALLQMNAYNLAAKGSNNEKDIKEIQSKQLKIADRFKKISNFFRVKSGKAEVAADKSSKELEKKLKISDMKSSKDSIW